jgi:hypothetical protein
MNGLACHKMLWLGWHDPLPYSDPEPGSPQQVGTYIGEKAQLLFPGGVLVDEAPWEHKLAVERTRMLMADPSVPAIFEAAYEYSGTRIRADIMERLENNTWGLREVKSSSRVKASYVDDVGVQLYVLHGLGVDVTSIELIHVNKAYVRGSYGIDWPEFFTRANLTQDANGACRNVGALANNFFDILGDKDPPDITAGKQCPSTCDYWDHCTQHMPEDWIYNLPRLSAQKFEELRNLGIEAIQDIPDDFNLSPTQNTVRKVLRCGKPFISPNLSETLLSFEPPIYYLDFEAMSPAIPLYPGTRPFQRIPFQWSLHHVKGQGNMMHEEFLAPGDTDPTLEFATTLIDAVGRSDDPIIVYSSFEKGTLNNISEQFPQISDEIQAIVERLVDLLPIVRGHTYFPGYNGSFSIKTVAPTLAPHLSYKDLDQVADGLAASAVFERIASGNLSPDEDAVTLRAALLEYCKLDTLAMVEVHVALLNIV